MPVIAKTFKKNKRRFDANPNDFYETPARLCRAVWVKLFETYGYPAVGSRVLDPGCGTGNWGSAASTVAEGLDITGIDIDHQYLYNDPNHAAYNNLIRCDYTDKNGMGGVVRDGSYHYVVGNPPYSSKSNKRLALDFTLAAFESARPDGIVALLFKEEFLGSKVRYEELYSHRPPHVMWYLDRVPFYANSKKTNTINYAMFVWNMATVSQPHDIIVQHLRWKLS